jgi:prolyl oligopeptidase
LTRAYDIIGNDGDTLWFITDLDAPRGRVVAIDRAEPGGGTNWRRWCRRPRSHVTEQVFYTSKDGTRVPMFITHKKGLKLDGKNPTLLYGYGGFNISLTPSFSVSDRRVDGDGRRLRRANLRGGGEYGKAWHEAGTKLKKAERVRRLHRRGGMAHREQVHAARKLAISGGSNGGLLVGRGAWPAPRAVRRGAARGRRAGHAALPQVHARLGLGQRLRLADDADEFKALLAYSPYAQLKPGVLLPADDGDDGRPRRPRRARAQLQVRRGVAGAQAVRIPVLIRIETKRRPRRRQAGWHW